MKTRVAPSILSAHFGHLQAELDSVSSADWVQIDVMDGHFVPNLSFGAPIVKKLKTKLLIDVHLMVSNPADRIDEFLAVGAKNITFHAEAVTATNDRKALIERIRKGGAGAGIAINPGTPVSAIDDVIQGVDLVLVMSVYPGFGGQTFIPAVLEKVKQLRSKYPKLMIQIDGGIDVATAALAKDAGADNLVAGNAIFSVPDRAAAIKAIRG